MERVIDRKEYRRNIEKNNLPEDEQVDIWQKRIRKILFQSLAVSTILLIISFLKFFNCNELLIKIDDLLRREISVSSIQKSGQSFFEKSTKYYTNLEKFINKIFLLELEVQANKETYKENSDSIFSELSGELVKDKYEKNENEIIIYENTISGDGQNLKYEMAVEGMNQMLDDTKYIKENYKMIIPVVGTVTSEFGVRNSENPKVSNYHSGLDIAANTGTQILSALNGEVIEIGNDMYLGKYFKIQLDEIIMTYAHCSKILVKKGDKIEKGKLIAYVGNTGNSTGPHLHFEIRYQNRLINPKDVLDL